MSMQDRQIAYVNSQVACAMIEAMGMQAENRQREVLGECCAYTFFDFQNLLTTYGLYHNDVLTTLQIGS